VKATRPTTDPIATEASALEDELRTLIEARPMSAAPLSAIQGTVVGQLIGIREDDCRTALVVYPGQPGRAAIAARSTVELSRGQIGHEVVLMFDRGEPTEPIVIGAVRHTSDHPAGVAELLDLDADGQRLTLTAKDQIVLRCGKASITLTRHGKVIIQGTYVSSQSSGVLRIKGGSVQIN